MHVVRSCCKRFKITLFVIAIIGIFTLTNTAWATDSGVINGSVVNIRSGPGTNYTIAGTILKNTPVQILQTQGNWDKIQFGSLTGWVSSSLITVNQSNTVTDPGPTKITTTPPRVLLDGKELNFEVAPVIENSRTLVPLRAIFEAMGADVQWNESTRTVTATKGSKVVVLPLNSTSPTINGVVYPLDTTAKIVNNRTLAPLRFVGEAFDGTVNWDAATRTIFITSPTEVTPPDPDPPTPPEPAPPDSSIKLSSSRDESGVKIIMQSDVALTPNVSPSSGQVVYKFEGRQITGTNYIRQALGSDTMTVQAGSTADDTTITFNLPAQIKYNTLSQDNGKMLVFSIPNYIIDLQTAKSGNNSEKIILSTLCPVKYTSQQTGDKIQVSLSNILQGQAQNKYDINGQYLDSINITAGDASHPGIILNIAGRNLDKVSFGVSGSNYDLNIILSGKASQPGGNNGGGEEPPAEYQVNQEYIVNNRPGTPLNPSGQVVHATADQGATAQNIHDYFNNHPAAEASAHAVIDWNSIIELIPENEMAWHAGPTANSRFLSFEMCEPAADDPNRFSKFQEVWNRAVWYCAKTCVKYSWNTNDNIFSHYGTTQMYHETNHTDPYGYFASYGKTWDQFLANVDSEISKLQQWFS